jgi:hypothetical protein
MIPHDLVFSADLFEVAGAVVVRANGPIIRDVNAWPRSAKFCYVHQPTHELHDDRGHGFWRDDLGVFVVPSECLTAIKEADL